MKNMVKSAMVFAAGRGMRLRPLTLTKPKPLVPVDGKPVLMRTLEHLAKAGVVEVVINIQYLGDKLEEAVYLAQMDGQFPELTIHFSYEPELLETGGGLKKALPLLGEGPFLLVNSDAVWLEDQNPLLPKIVEAFDPETMEDLLAVVPTKTAAAFRETGDFELESGTLQFTADKENAPYIYAGIQVATPKLVEGIEDEKFSLTVPWRNLAAKGKLHGFVYDGPWAEMGTHEGLTAANNLLANQKVAKAS